MAQSKTKQRTLDKREYLMIIGDMFFYVVTPHLNHLIETVQMRGHNIWFQSEIRKIIPQLLSHTPSYLEL